MGTKVVLACAGTATAYKGPFVDDDDTSALLSRPIGSQTPGRTRPQNQDIGFHPDFVRCCFFHLLLLLNAFLQ
jgi:hypothetical protein